jgi:hypothetical protein
MSGGNALVDANSNKTLPMHGTQASGVGAQYVLAAPAGQDPVGKIRVSTPQALIDTDFEYGQQPTKWESIALQNNRPGVYNILQTPLTVTAITGNGTTTVTLTGTFVIAANSFIYIQNAVDANANGWWFTAAGGTNSIPDIKTTNVVAAGNQYNPALSYVYLGYQYTGSGIQVGSNAFTTNGTATVSVATTNPHGLTNGSLIYILNTSSGSNSVNGAQVVATTPTANSFTFTNCNGTVTAAAVTNSAANNVIYSRPAGYVESRSFDGGVAFSAGAAVPNSQLIRQTRRYFRYQSGKGIQFSTGTSLAPSLFVTSITSSGTTATITTRFAHNVAVGCVIVVSNVDQPQYNGTFTVTAVTATTLTYTMLGAASASPATGLPLRVNPLNWYGSSNRVGFFDTQNGLFFEYDGQTLYAVSRNSVTQGNGTIAVTQGSTAVTGTGTQFSTQFKPGDFCVIRGQSYRILNIISDTSMYISPEYRGTTISGGALISKTIDTRVPRSQWADPLDGTGPSGYTLDITRMQMLYIDYSWYGAGFARFGMRTTKGQVAYVHQFTNNNFRYEAYMRSGNMAARYESNGIPPVTTLTATLGTGGSGTVINVADASLFPPTGTIRVVAASQTGVVEHISYSARTATTITVNARAQTGGQGSAQTFTYSATAPIAVEYYAPDTVASLSHWGSSVIMDGQFNDDKSLIFNYGMSTALNTTALTPVPILAIRLAPSVDNGTVGLLGAKEIINRMQLELNELQLFTTGTTGYLVNLILNGYVTGTFSGNSGNFVSPTSTQSPTTSSLAQVNFNTTPSVTISGGESVAGAYTPVSGPLSIDLSRVRDLGNSILGGGTSNTIPTSQLGVYPDGPDILYVVAVPLSTTSATIQARLSWKEAQA